MHGYDLDLRHQVLKLYKGGSNFQRLDTDSANIPASHTPKTMSKERFEGSLLMYTILSPF